MRFVLPFATPSQNEYQRWHWAKKAKFRDQCCLILRVQMRQMGYQRLTTPIKMAVEVHRCGPRQLDYGNLVGGCKHVIDALVRERILHDDSPTWVQEHYSQTSGYAKGHGFTEIYVVALLNVPVNVVKVAASSPPGEKGESDMPTKKKTRAVKAQAKTGAKASGGAGKKKTAKKPAAKKTTAKKTAYSAAERKMHKERGIKGAETRAKRARAAKAAATKKRNQKAAASAKAAVVNDAPQAAAG